MIVNRLLKMKIWFLGFLQEPLRLRTTSHVCFHKNMASSFQREVFSMSLLITHMYAMYSVNLTLSLTGPGWPPIINDAGVMMRLTVWSRSEMWNIMRTEFLLSQWKRQSPRSSSRDPFSCTDLTLLTVTRRDKSSPQCHIRMTGDWSRVRTWERARSQRLNPLCHMCFHKTWLPLFREKFAPCLC